MPPNASPSLEHLQAELERIDDRIRKAESPITSRRTVWRS